MQDTEHSKIPQGTLMAYFFSVWRGLKGILLYGQDKSKKQVVTYVARLLQPAVLDDNGIIAGNKNCLLFDFKRQTQLSLESAFYRRYRISLEVSSAYKKLTRWCGANIF